MVDGEKCNSSKENWHIRIILVAPGCLFPLAKTLPAKCCIRIPNTNAVETHKRPTPFYNSTIRSECSTMAYQRLLNYTSTQSEAYQDACILGGVWLRRRGLRTELAAGGFGQFEWACMMALLLRKDDSGKKPLFSKGYNSYQLFKATLHFIAASDLCLEPLIMGCESLELVDQKGPVFFDGAQGFNILFKMTDWSYRLVNSVPKYEATYSLTNT
jgi:U3 small nucleolar RNA-associated protein 22